MSHEFRRWIELLEAKVAAPARIAQKSKIKAPDTAAFRKWFGASKVVDRQGRPLVCYHGTHQQFDAFDPNVGSTTLIFFSANPAMANGYAAGVGDNAGANVLPVYLRMIKPYDYRHADNESIAYAFYRAYGPPSGDDARMVRIALYGRPDVEDDDNPDITTDFLEIDEFITALNQGEYPALELFDFLEFLLGHGFDGIITYEVKSINYGVFAASQVKSVFSREFNPDSAKLSEADRVEPVCEGRDAPLYHATDAMRAANILASNQLRGITTSSNAYADSGYKGHSKSFGDGTGVSLSRDRTFAHHWWQADWPNSGRVVLVFNQAKLMRDGFRLKPERHPASERYGGDQSEEFLFGSINDVSKYLDAIEITQDSYEQLNRMDSNDVGRRGNGLEQPGIKRIKMMLQNPKLRIIPGRERNRSDPRKTPPRSNLP